MNICSSILFLDDSNLNHKFAKIFFQKTHFQEYITYSKCPIEALYFSKSMDFDLLIVDYMMPILNGDEFIQLMRELHSEKPPVIAFSSDYKLNEQMSKFDNVIAYFNKDFVKLKEYISDHFKFRKRVM